MKKKALIVSNLTKRFQPGHYSMISPLEDMGFEVHWAANFTGYEGELSEAPCLVHQIDFNRNPFNTENAKAFKQLRKLMKENKYEVVHCQSPIGGVMGRLCGNLENVDKIIYTAHGFHFYKGAPLINKIIYKTAEKLMARFTDAIIVMNEEDFVSARKLKIRNKHNVFKIHGIGVDTTMYDLESFDRNEYKKELGLRENSLVVISMGDLIDRKNYGISIKAIAKSKNPNIDYLICGMGKNESELRELAIELGVENQIHFLGYRSDIAELLNCSDLFLFSTLQEGMPRSMMEAMSTKLPCLASDIRGNKDLLVDGKGGFLYAPNDYLAFSEGINKIIMDVEIKKDMGEFNKKEIKKYDIENVKKEMNKIYNKVLVR